MLVSLVTPLKYLQTLTLFAMGPFNPILAIWTIFFQDYYDLALSSEDVSIFGYTLKVSSELNPFSHGGCLTLF